MDRKRFSSPASSREPSSVRGTREAGSRPSAAIRLPCLLVLALIPAGSALAAPYPYPALHDDSELSGLLPDPASLREMLDMAGSLGESGFSHGDGFPVETGDEGSNDIKAWTLMFYDDADFDSAFDPLDSFCGEAVSSSSLNVIVLQDTEFGPASLWYISPAHEPILLVELGEVDMGDGETLSDFIQWTKEHYPAERYMMTMYDHGGGWWGACIDKSSGGDLLYMEEIRQAIAGAGGLDILCFTAPCLMGAVESVYELRDCVDVYIGSENVSGYVFWFENVVDICGALNSSDPLSNEEIATIIVEAVLEGVPPEYENYMTMSAADASATLDLAGNIDELAVYMAAHIDELGDNIQTVRNSTWELGTVDEAGFSEIDLIDFLMMYYAVETDPFVHGKIGEILSSFYQVLICEVNGSGQDRSHGLSILFPERRATFPVQYTLLDLDFADDTAWDEFLEAFYDFQATGIQGGASSHGVQGPTAFPSPFHGSTEIRFATVEDESLVLRIQDCSGRTVRILFEGSLSGGSHTLVWDGRGGDGSEMPSGMYFCSLENGGVVSSDRMLLLR